jgi:hypothetical protein
MRGAGEKKPSTEWINIQLAFRKSAAAANHDHHHDLRSTTTNKSPHTISTLHNLPHRHHIAIMGNGAKAASKRERNAKDAGSVAKSQLKSVRFFSPANAPRSPPLLLRKKEAKAFHVPCQAVN